MRQGEREDAVGGPERRGWAVEFQKFEELEGKLKILVSEYLAQKTKIQELEELLKNKITETEEVNGRLKGLKEERDAVRAKVDSLLDLLQDVSIPQ